VRVRAVSVVVSTECFHLAPFFVEFSKMAGVLKLEYGIFGLRKNRGLEKRLFRRDQPSAAQRFSFGGMASAADTMSMSDRPGHHHHII